jgi:hypothetical protein
MPNWTIAAHASRETLRLRVRNCLGDELLHARLPLPPDHPRALLSLLEGLALWVGEPLCAVISADDAAEPSLSPGDSWTPTSALVRFELAPPRVAQRRLRLARVRRRPQPHDTPLVMTGGPKEERG